MQELSVRELEADLSRVYAYNASVKKRLVFTPK